MTNRIHGAAALGGALLVAACGGGGDGGASGVTIPTGTRSVTASAGSDATTGNAVALGGDLALAVLNGSGDALLGTTADGTAGPKAAVPTGPGAAQVQRHWLRWAARTGGSTTAGPTARPLAVTEDRQLCPLGGELIIVADDADNNQRLSRNDAITITAIDCVLEPGLPATDGTFRLVINAVELSGVEPVAFDASVTFTSFTVAGEGTANGNARFWWRQQGASSEQWRLGYQAMRFTVGSSAAVYDFDLAGTTDANGSRFELSGGLGVGGNLYSVVPRTQFQSTGNAAPATGSVELRDAAGDLVRLTARSASSYDLDFVPAGATAPSFTQAGLAWPGSGT